MVSCWVASSVQLLQLWVSLHLAVAAAAAGAGAAVSQRPGCHTAAELTADENIAQAMHANAYITT